MKRTETSRDDDRRPCGRGAGAEARGLGLLHARSWRGDVVLDEHGGVFRGIAGHNEMHAHGAHQVSIGLDGPVTVWVEGRSIRGAAVSIAAACRHRLVCGSVISVYADVSSSLGRAIRERSSGDVCVLPTWLAGALSEVGKAEGRLDRAAAAKLVRIFGGELANRTGDPVLRGVCDALRTGTHLTRAELASLAGRSESRFSHWFRECVGMPMRTYRKWQRLTVAVDRILDGQTMATAAIDAGFADQAHFVRTFRAMLGINPVAALGEARRA